MTIRSARSAKNALVALVAAVMLVTVAAGCGGGGGGGGEAAATAMLTPTVQDGVQVFGVVGQADLTFSARELVASPGRIRVDFSVAKGSAPHNFVISQLPGASTDILSTGESQTITFTATEPGEYPVICTLHPAMTATLVVR
ncbi:cupredoxin domain-containing protein [Parafrankia sp. FMc2]|uniref:cupredoxin domain-containing protein n=1 Tax=Parafrankia sp. FMc2 TaxID=3233196 RepID=UPI0034D5B8FA